MPSVLLVEDDPERAREIQGCMPSGWRCVWAQFAGAAMGILRRGRFAAVLLDYDLHQGSMGDARVTGEHVAMIICETQNRGCQGLIHSQSVAGAGKMAAVLEEGAFEAEIEPWAGRGQEVLRDWLG